MDLCIDRREVGRRLAQLAQRSPRDKQTYDGARGPGEAPPTQVMAMVPGGAPLAVELAEALHAPVVPWITRKLTLPALDDVVLGCVGSGGGILLDDEVIRRHELQASLVVTLVERAWQDVLIEERSYGATTTAEIDGSRAVLVTDGLVPLTDLTAALRLIQRQHPETVTLCIPSAPPSVRDTLGPLVDEIVFLTTTASVPFAHTEPTSVEEAREILAEAMS